MALYFVFEQIHIVLCLIQVQPRKRPNLTEKLLIVANIDAKTVPSAKDWFNFSQM